MLFQEVGNRRKPVHFLHHPNYSEEFLISPYLTWAYRLWAMNQECLRVYQELRGKLLLAVSRVLRNLLRKVE
jgi:hypothetical protein